MTVWSFRFCAAVTILSSSLAAIAAEIKIISSVGMRAVLEELQPQFEGTTQHKLIITFGTAAPLKRQVDEGAAFDVTILTPPMLEDLAKSGKVETGSVVSVAKTGIGLAARKDSAPLDIASAEGLKRALLAAKSVAHSKEGQSGVAAVKIMERLGIAEEMKPRIVIETRPGGSVTAVVEGKAELGFALVSEIVPVPEVKLVGPVPGDLQSYTVFAAGVSSNTKDALAARSFVEFLRGASARSTLSAKGMEGMQRSQSADEHWRAPRPRHLSVRYWATRPAGVGQQRTEPDQIGTSAPEN